MLFAWDNGGRLHHRSASSWRLERAARAYTVSPASSQAGSVCRHFCSLAGWVEQGRVAASERAWTGKVIWGGACNGASDHPGHFFAPSFRLSPVRLNTQRDLSVSRLPLEIDVWLGSFASFWGLFAVIGVAIMIAAEEPRLDFSQIARPDWLEAQHAEKLRTGRSAVHQCEPHRRLPSGLSLFHSTFAGGTRTSRLLCVLRRSCRQVT
jgi:hypothetical protein